MNVSYIWVMPSDNGPEMPQGTDDERELLLRWLAFLRGAVLRKAEGISDDEARVAVHQAGTPAERLYALAEQTEELLFVIVIVYVATLPASAL